jgi:hypothetical protein
MVQRNGFAWPVSFCGDNFGSLQDLVKLEWSLPPGSYRLVSRYSANVVVSDWDAVLRHHDPRWLRVVPEGEPELPDVCEKCGRKRIDSLICERCGFHPLSRRD